MVINSAAWIPHPAGIGGPGSRLIESFTSGPSLIARSSSDWGAMHAAPELMNDVRPMPLRRHLAVRADQSGTGLLGGEERERSLRRLPSKITSRRGPEARASHVSSWPCFILQADGHPAGSTLQDRVRRTKPGQTTVR